MMGGGIILVAASNGVASVLVARLAGDGDDVFNRLLAFNVVANTFVALGMHLIVFENMTDELRRTNRELASANEEVRRLAITEQPGR